MIKKIIFLFAFFFLGIPLASQAAVPVPVIDPTIKEVSPGSNKVIVNLEITINRTNIASGTKYIVTADGTDCFSEV